MRPFALREREREHLRGWMSCPRKTSPDAAGYIMCKLKNRVNSMITGGYIHKVLSRQTNDWLAPFHRGALPSCDSRVESQERTPSDQSVGIFESSDNLRGRQKDPWLEKLKTSHLGVITSSRYNKEREENKKKKKKGRGYRCLPP